MTGDEQELAQLFKPAEKDQFDDRGAFIRSFWDVSPAFQHLRKLHRLKFTIQYRGKENDPKTYTIMRFMYDPKFGQAGADALTYKFDWDGKMTSVDDFFRKKYKLFLKYPKMPLIETSRSGVYPIEVCHLLPFQRYNFKLDPDQVRVSKFYSYSIAWLTLDVDIKHDQVCGHSSTCSW